MELEEKIIERVGELKDFMEKQQLHMKEYESIISSSVEKIDNEEQKAQVFHMLEQAKKGNIKEVQRMAEILQNIKQ